ncbi:MAG: hypothetical protein M1835_006362 [Candelina submexicana]|nr:MAG: hypothetical protein M1835_006362 [Candelina submexicana]
MRTKKSHSSASITLSPPKLKRLVTSDIEEMPEVPSDEVLYNERTGRPIRSTRSKRCLKELVHTESVDSDDYLTDTEDHHIGGGDEDQKMITGNDSVAHENAPAIPKLYRNAKDRIRDLSPSIPPPSPGPSPTPPRQITPADDMLERCPSVTPNFTNNTSPAAAPLQLVFNVPPGFQGPFIVKLDMASLMASIKPTTPQIDQQTFQPQGVHGDSRSQQEVSALSSLPPATAAQSAPQTTGLGFQCLPPELRNKVYRLLFVGDRVLLHDKRDLSRSASFLRTCRQVYEEGRTVLYGENIFKLDRCGLLRGHYYDKTWSEIGYKDFERFLKLIGPKNISLIREMHLQLTDGAPSAFPDATYEARRFINDVHLRECLKLLAKHSQLRKLTLGFWGRRQVALWDLDFLSLLRMIKVGELDLERRFYSDSRTALDVRESLLAAMVKVKPEASKSATKKRARDTI